MKYLKKFESIDNKMSDINLYEPISIGEYGDKREESIWFNQLELGYLCSFNQGSLSAVSYPERNFFKIESQKHKYEIYK